METRSQLTSKDLVLHWRDQTLHEGNHKIVNKENISSGERQSGVGGGKREAKKRRERKGKNYRKNLKKKNHLTKKEMGSRWF